MCCRQRTCTILKSFRCNTYKKIGGGRPACRLLVLILGTLSFPRCQKQESQATAEVCSFAQGNGLARSNRSRKVLRLCSRRSRSHLSPGTRPGPRLPGPQWLGKKHHGKSAHRPPPTYSRASSLRGQRHSKRSRILSKAARLRS